MQPFNIHGFWKLTSYKKLTWVLMWQWARWKIFRTSMLHQSSNRPRTLLSHPSSCQSKRRQTSIKYSELWMSMVMESFQKMRSRTVTLNSLVRVWRMSKLTKCLLRSTQMVMVRSITLSSLLPLWMRRTYWATINFKQLSRCSTRMVEVLSLRMR